MQPDKLNRHIHVCFTRGSFVRQDSRSLQARSEITAACILKKNVKKINLIAYGKHFRMIGGNEHKTQAVVNGL